MIKTINAVKNFGLLSPRKKLPSPYIATVTKKRVINEK